MSWDCGFAQERTRRLVAARRAWWDLRAMWSCKCDLRYKLLLFKSIVMSTLLSGLTAFVVTARDLVPMEAFIARCARCMLCGRACSKVCEGDATVYKALTNAHVLRRLQLSTVETELRVARLRWLQSMLKRPGEHAQVFAALLGDFPFEVRSPMQFESGCTHPWLQQMYDDLEQSASYDNAQPVVDDIGGDLRCLLRDE
eukprot:3926071-Alexandrium_andersonii.AAC.1